MRSIARFSAVKLAVAGLLAATLAAPMAAYANHSVLVEGETDFDGDGLIGAAEDADGDAVFGRINSAIGNSTPTFPGNLANNGKALIVTSGRFPEIVVINGPVTLEAAPGVDAVIEAFLSPAVDAARLADFDTPTANNASRQMAPGIIVTAPPIRPVVIRNVSIRNWTDAIRVNTGQVLIDNCRIDHNTNHGINVIGTPGVPNAALVAIRDTAISSTGFRINPNSGMFPDANMPMPGIGVRFQNLSKGDIFNSSVSSSFSVGLLNQANLSTDVFVRDTQMFGNQFQNNNDTGLRDACRAATPNFDQAELCFQRVLRQILGIQDGAAAMVPPPAPAP